ncbi:hypothetical protein PHLH8_20590 [Pseudomonas sp. Pc102]|uniref:hypothetical protein n=1 Tax=Pseudomonas sp. Pc102 TaxID=2678261 RepID=UPI001BCCA802|nr:hypothetical protein [Pseudomonas sp. Pc102]BBP82417.1 hypothetical protein PHLH8_20590 [Pseudomonas sp. Pc102]
MSDVNKVELRKLALQWIAASDKYIKTDDDDDFLAFNAIDDIWQEETSGELVLSLLDESDSLQAERDQLRAELAAIRGQEPFGFVSEIGMERVKTGRSGAIAKSTTGRRCIPLYALPPQQPDAVSVPREWIDAVRFAEAMLTNLQPHIVQACYPGRARFLDNYVDPVLDKFRALLSTRQAEEGE